MRITGVAINVADERTVYSLPSPNRHHDVINMMVEEFNCPTPITGEQGFILENGNFISREEALILARENGQLLKEHHPTKLFSEELW